MTTIDEIKRLLNELSEAHNTHIEKIICLRLASLSYKEDLNSKDLKSILNDCAYYVLASDEGMEVLLKLWKEMKKIEHSSFKC